MFFWFGYYGDTEHINPALPATASTQSSSLTVTLFHLPPQNRIEPRLITFAIPLEPMNNIRIQPDRNRLFHGAIKLAHLKTAEVGDFRDV